MNRNVILRALLGLAFLAAAGSAAAQATIGTAFTFQGELRDGGAPAEGSYDFRARLYVFGGDTLLAESVFDDVALAEGRFALPLDFTDVVFRDFGDLLAVEIAARAASSTGDWNVLGPRVRVESAPYALVSRTVMPGSIGATEIDPTQVQSRVNGVCPPDAAINAIGADGSVTCDVDTAGVTITPGFGIVGGGGSGQVSLAINPAEVQRRVNGSCAAGSSIRTINEDGTVDCEVDDGAGPVVPVSTTRTFGGTPGFTTTGFGSTGCPAGTHVISGGFQTNCPGVFVYNSSPNTAATAWSAEVLKPSTVGCPGNTGQLTIHAVCAPL